MLIRLIDWYLTIRKAQNMLLNIKLFGNGGEMVVTLQPQTGNNAAMPSESVDRENIDNNATGQR
jgi:hypothetical protein